MRLWIILCCFVLVGCSVTIDEPVDSLESQEELEQPQNLQQDNSEEVKETPQALVDFLQDLLPFQKDQHINYIALGDSLTRGVGDERDFYGFTGRLSDYLREQPKIAEVKLDNRGKNGRRSDQLLNLMERGHYDEELKEADFITITLGGNDVMKVVKSDVFNLKKEMFEEALPPFVERYRKIIAGIRQQNASAPILMLGFYNPFSIITEETEALDSILNDWNDEIEKIANEDVNACYVPVADLFTSNDDLVYHTDFFHPNARGYERMTKRVIERMKDCDIEKMSDGVIVVEE